MAEDKKGFSPEEEAALKSALSDVESKMGKKAAEQIELNIKTAVEPLIAAQNKEIEGLKAFKIEAETSAAENQKWIDEQIKKQKEIQVTGSGSMNAEISKAFNENAEAIHAYTAKGRVPVKFEIKTVGNIGATNFTTTGTPAWYPGGILWEPGRKPYEPRHIRELPGVRVVALPPGMDTYVIRMTTQEGGPTVVAMGDAKPKSDIDWTKTVVPVTKIAHYYKIPEEYLADIPWLQDEITGVGVEELLVLEDTMILTNNGAATTFLGLNQSFNSTAFSAPVGLSGIFVGAIEANNYDVLVAAVTQLRILKSFATAILVNPADYAAMILTKDTTGNYPFGAPNQNIPNIFGAPIIAHTAVTQDKFFVGDFSKVKIGVRNGLSVRFYDQNEDDAIKNMVTVVIEERITMAADRADRIIYGDFSDAQTSLES